MRGRLQEMLRAELFNLGKAEAVLREGTAPAMLSRWLGEEEDEAPFSITSDEYSIASEEAFVASARCRCVKCGKNREVVCLYCKSGVDIETGDPIADFTVSNIWAMDGVLAKLMQRWPYFRKGVGEDSGEENFANHCPHCGAMQEDYLLHSEPGDVFFFCGDGHLGSG